MTEQMENEVQSVEKMGFMTKATRLITDPQSMFENLRLHPDWLLPVLVGILVTIAFAFLISDVMFEFQKDAIYENSMIPEEFKDVAIEQMENKTVMRRNIETIAGSLIQVFLVYLIGAGAFFLVGNFFMGGQAKFKQLFSLFSWVGLIGVLEMGLKLPLILRKGSMQVYTSLAVLMDLADKKTVLFSILNAFDVFMIWKVILWSIGMSVIYQFSRAKGYTAVISLYVIFIAISVGLGQLF